MKGAVHVRRERLIGRIVLEILVFSFHSRANALLNFAISQKYSLTVNRSPEELSLAFLTMHMVQYSLLSQ